MIAVHVKLLGYLNNKFPDLQPGQAMTIEIPEQTTLEQLAQQLELPSYKMAFVNNTHQKNDFLLNDQDKVAFIPPIAGG